MSDAFAKEMPDPIKVGDKIWRDITPDRDGPFILPLECEKANGRGHFFKAVIGRFIKGTQMVATDACSRRGLTCFIDQPPTQNEPWTYMEVIRVPQNARSVVVKMVCGDSQELFAQYTPQVGDCSKLFVPKTPEERRTKGSWPADDSPDAWNEWRYPP